MPRLVHKHPRLIRYTHWLNVPVLFIMIYSGLMIYWAYDPYRIGWGDHTLFKFFPDAFNDALGLKRQLARGMAWHFAFAWLFAVNWLAYVITLMITGEWRELIPHRASLREAWQVLLHDLHLSNRPLPNAKFNAAQRIAYSGVILMGAGALLTGLAILKPIQLHWLTAALGGYEAARAEHFILMLAYVAFFIIHVIQVLKAGWNNLRAMITGYELSRDQPPIAADAAPTAATEAT